MILLILPRDDNPHIVDYETGSKYYHTLCGKLYSKTTPINSLELNDIIDGVCKKCKPLYDHSRALDLIYDKTYIFDKVQKDGNYVYFARLHKDIVNIRLTKRNWGKLNKFILSQRSSK